jgi:hemolysin III
MDVQATAEDLIPTLRGVSHAVAFWIALVAGGVLIAIAPDADARLAALIYAVGLCALFGASGLYHRWRWNPRWRPILRRIDHSTIFVFVAASYTPVALLVLEGGWRTGVLTAVWVGALAGVVFSVFWISAPRWLVAGSYVGLGWVAIVALPELVDKLPAPPLVLLTIGGVLYSVGAAVYARKRPDPWPRVFGFHEVFHAFVVAAAVAHFVAIAGWVITAAPA